MSVRHKISRQGLELIKGFEGLRQTASRLPDGRWTIGYGHTLSAREGATVSAEDAEALLLYDLMPVMKAVGEAVTVPLTQSQFDALISFAFNVGLDLFKGSNVLSLLNAGHVQEAAAALDGWRTAEFNGQTYVLEPLVRRREAEKALFLTPGEATILPQVPVAVAAEPEAEEAPSVSEEIVPVVEVPEVHPDADLGETHEVLPETPQEAAVSTEAEAEFVPDHIPEQAPEPEPVAQAESDADQQGDPQNTVTDAEDELLAQKRKADAEAALMRFYSPYGTRIGGGALPSRAVTPQSVVDNTAQPSTPAQAFSAPPVQAEPAPQGVDVPTEAEVEAPALLTQETVPPQPKPVEQRHWREVLQRPLPAKSVATEPMTQTLAQPVSAPLFNSQAEAVPVEPEESESLFSTMRPTQLAATPDPVVDEWTVEDRIALTLDEVREVDESWLSKFLSTLKLIIFSCLGMVCIGGGVAAYLKGRNSEVMRQGFVDDYTKLSGIMAAFGVLLVFVAIWLILRRLAGLKT